MAESNCASFQAMTDQHELSEWGPEDQLGAANRMTSATRQNALQRIRHGKEYELGVRVTSESPVWRDRHHKVQIRQLHVGDGDSQITFFDDFLDMSVGVGTHVDTLAHVAVSGKMYNGLHVEDVFDKNGVKCLGMDSISSFIAPVVILDIAGLFGVQIMAEGTCIKIKHIEDALSQQNVSISSGDIVCLYTGWINYFDGTSQDREKFRNAEPGIGSEAAKYLADLGVIMVASDNWGLEVKPKEEGEPESPVHRMLIKERGIYIGEMFDLRALVRDQIWIGTIVIQLVRNQGTVQARCNPQVFV